MVFFQYHQAEERRTISITLFFRAVFLSRLAVRYDSHRTASITVCHEDDGSIGKGDLGASKRATVEKTKKPFFRCGSRSVKFTTIIY